MEKKDIASILNDVLVPIGFKKKGNYWVINGDEITKMANLQKSQFSNSFYINYGYIIRGLELTPTMHIFKGLGSADGKENKRITDLLNLENSIAAEERLSDLKRFICDKIVADFRDINTEEDILRELKQRPHLNNIPLIVKKHFNLA